MTHSQEWPSLTCQWLPTVRNVSDEVAEHSLLIGTHTTGEQNYLMVAGCSLPRDPGGPVEDKEGGGTAKKAGAPPYNDDKQEIGGHGAANSDIGKLEIRMKVKHEGEVNR